MENKRKRGRPAYPEQLKAQLKLYDAMVVGARKRLAHGYNKYKDAYLQEDLHLECISEVLDMFNYLILMKMKQRQEEECKTVK